jgi:hypothetical protein
MVQMRRQPVVLSVSPRARAKQASRVRDASALASGRKSLRMLARENESFVALASRASVNLAASRSLG